MKTTQTLAVIVILSVIIAIGRFTVPGHGLSYAGSYEAFAHIWVGALIVLAVNGDEIIRRASISVLFLLTVLEIVMFAIR